MRKNRYIIGIYFYVYVVCCSNFGGMLFGMLKFFFYIYKLCRLRERDNYFIEYCLLIFFVGK